MKQKKGFLTRDIIITALLFGVVVAIFTLAITDVSSNYGNSNLVDAAFSEKYDKLSALTAKVETARSSSSAGSKLSFVGAFDVAFKSTFTVIQMVFQSLALYTTMVDDFVSDYTFLDSGVMSTLLTVGLAILTVFLVFIWISSISRGRV